MSSLNQAILGFSPAKSILFLYTPLNLETPSIIIICRLGSIEYDIVLKFQLHLTWNYLHSLFFSVYTVQK